LTHVKEQVDGGRAVRSLLRTNDKRGTVWTRYGDQLRRRRHCQSVAEPDVLSGADAENTAHGAKPRIIERQSPVEFKGKMRPHALGEVMFLRLEAKSIPVKRGAVTNP